MKEIHDNSQVIGILRSIGASSRQILGIIFRESILLSLIAACIGLAGGVLLAMLIESTDQLIAFGHVIDPVLDPIYLLAAALGSIGICMGSSLASGISASRRVTIRVVRGIEDEAVQSPTLEELLRDTE